MMPRRGGGVGGSPAAAAVLPLLPPLLPLVPRGRTRCHGLVGGATVVAGDPRLKTSLVGGEEAVAAP